MALNHPQQATASVLRDSPAWQALTAHYTKTAPDFDLRRAFDGDAKRFERLSIEAPHVFADFSKNYLDASTLAALHRLAEQCQVEQRRDAMFAGAAINHTEERQVLHTALRRTDAELTGELAVVAKTRHAFLDFAESVRANPKIRDVVSIGIGGSDLGPRMAVHALAPFNDSGKRIHFVANVDPQELLEVLAQCQADSTLFIIASKTFSTLETMTNARSALAWFAAQGGSAVAEHFVGITTNIAAAQALGIRTTFGFWDWVGGRFSLWSAIGLSLAISIGRKGFSEFLAGARAMDEHFKTAPIAQNLPINLALLDVWNRNFYGFNSRTIAAYSHGLDGLGAHLQQLEMESNGKGVDHQGRPLQQSSAGVVWGQVGCNGQHAFFQMLHQGTDIIPVEFIAVQQPEHDHHTHHQLLLANALAQAQALMQGKASSDGHRHFPGNRPSTFLLLRRLDPASLGALLALYEHRVFVAGCIWNINSFDQFGVELGKVLAQDIAPRLCSGDVSGLDGSSAGLIARLRS